MIYLVRVGEINPKDTRPTDKSFDGRFASTFVKIIEWYMTNDLTFLVDHIHAVAITNKFKHSKW